jgi:hypothetical protein
MGVGKSYVLSKLFQKQLFPLDAFIKIDPDMLKSELPEMAGYLQADPQSAATNLHRESTQMSDVLFEHALLHNHNILVDGSLRDVEWYKLLFGRLRREYPEYRLAILYVSASAETIRHRAATRATATGRAVPEDLLQASITQVPKSVQALTFLTDFTFEISNNDNEPMQLIQKSTTATTTTSSSSNEEEEKEEPAPTTATTTWDDFAKIWAPPTSSSSSDEATGTTKNTTVCPAEVENDLVCRMMEVFDDPEEHHAANAIWRASYPGFCARCALACDGQCGICVHDIHFCACQVCNRFATSCTRTK